MSRISSGLRIAILVEKLSLYGGTERFGWRLAERLAEQGHRVEVVCGRAETAPPKDVQVRTLGRPPLPRSAKILWFAIKARQVVRANAYDLTISLCNTLEQDLCRVSGGPIDVFHTLSIRAYPKGLSRSLKKLRRKLAPANMLIRCIQARQFRPNNRLVAVSSLVRDWLLQAHPDLDAHSIPLVYNKPDLQRFSAPTPYERNTARKRLNIPPDATVMVLAGTNFMLKGVATAIRAVHLLPDNFLLYVAGGRRPGRFLDLARELGVEDRIRFLGKVDDMTGLYHGADIFVLPSFYDTCSNAVLEARACGLKAVSSASNGSSFFLPPRWVLDDAADHKGLATQIMDVAAEKAPPPFVWPDTVQSGLDAFINIALQTARSKTESS